MAVAESTPEQSGYPGQQAKTLYAQKINHRRRPRRKQRKRGGHKSILLWAGAVLLLWLLLRLL